MSELRLKDLQTYTAYGLLATGSAFTDDYGEQDAIVHYLELHPTADRAAVEQELRDAMKSHGRILSLSQALRLGDSKAPPRDR